MYISFSALCVRYKLAQHVYRMSLSCRRRTWKSEPLPRAREVYSLAPHPITHSTHIFAAGVYVGGTNHTHTHRQGSARAVTLRGTMMMRLTSKSRNRAHYLFPASSANARAVAFMPRWSRIWGHTHDKICKQFADNSSHNAIQEWHCFIDWLASQIIVHYHLIGFWKT